MRSWQCVIVGFVLIVPALCRPQNYYTDVDHEAERSAYIRQLEAAVEGAARSGALSQAVLLEDRLEQSILQHAQDSAARVGGDPARAARDLETIQEEWRRDKRAVDFLSGLLGSSSGGGGRALSMANCGCKNCPARVICAGELDTRFMHNLCPFLWKY